VTALLRALFEIVRELVALIRRRLEDTPAPDSEHKPLTPKEEADRDVQDVNKAVVDGNVDDIMRMYDRLRDASMGADPAAKADAGSPEGAGDCDPG